MTMRTWEKDRTPTYSTDPSSPHWTFNMLRLGRISDCTALSPSTDMARELIEIDSHIEGFLTPVTDPGYGAMLNCFREGFWTEKQRTAPAPKEAGRETRASSDALAALGDVMQWLSINQADAAALANVAPRSIPNWRDGRKPRPASVRKLFGVHALLRSLTARLGPDETLCWVQDTLSDGRRRLDVLADEDGVAVLLRDARPFLFPTPRRHVLSTIDDNDDEDGPVEDGHHEHSKPVAALDFGGEVRRARRIP